MELDYLHHDLQKLCVAAPDPEGNIAGGVCSGIAYYFGFEPLWLRLIFVLSFLFGFGFSLIIYIILWIIIPEAKTAAEKLEMKGEPVNASNIGKKVEEEINHLKNKINNLSDQMGTSDGKKKAERGLKRLFNFFKNIIL